MKTLVAVLATTMVLTAPALAGFIHVKHAKPTPVKQVLVCTFTGSTSSVEVGGTATGMLCFPRNTK